ncbi:N-6 DNA methylase [Aulosira sp. FACHB-615]|uniref:N-6 DNA methylase n=1 Tax=Aulosira sp. FACHB-615 TaxID=2692777 RepID=UPI001688FC95|nr:N-6 DNA methylase [Aulosira sp. FACHB-615]MBD2487771.1 N-6 DNA methylase [Aulosira sp. FACHB-615]
MIAIQANKVKKNQSQASSSTLKCLVTNLPLRATPVEVAKQEILRQMLDSGYSKNQICLNSSFLGKNGQDFSADIIVLSTQAILHTEPLLVVSIGKKSATFSYDWVKSCQNSGAKNLIWFNGALLKVFSLNSEGTYRELPPFIPSWIELTKPEQLGYRLKSSLSPAYNLKRILADLHDHLYGNSNIRIPSRLGIEIQKLLLLKRFDEEQPSENSEFYIAQDELPCGFNGHKTISSESFSSVASRLYTLLNKYDAVRNEDQKIRSLELDPPSLYYAVFHLEGISLQKTPTDVLGDALETFRAYTVKREGGQFFTHCYVVDLALKLVGYRGDDNQTLADISCGTSGFLHRARTLIINRAKENGVIKEEEQNKLVSELILGVEIDQDLVQISNTSPEFFKLPNQLVERHDSLLPFEQWEKTLSARLAPNSRAFMVGNPPFGTKITVKDTETLKKYALAHTWKKEKNHWKQSPQKIIPRAPDILFIERNLNLLTPGIGKMVLVVPYQILSGPKEGFVREWLMTNCKIIAVVDLPEDTFQPYTGTKGSLLVVQKRANPNPNWEDEPDYPIFMACPQKIGHDRRGRAMFKEGTSDQIDTDLPEIAKAFDSFTEGEDPSKVTQLAFTISSKSIKSNTDIRFNAAYYRPSSIDLRQQLVTIVQHDLSLTITPLGELVKDIFYPGRFKRDYTESLENTVPFLGGSNIAQLIPVTEKRILKNSLHYEELALKSGWILVTRSGTTGIVSTVPEDWEGFAASEHIIRIIPNPEKLHPGYLSGYLRSQIGQRLLRDGVFGSVIDEISCSYIASIPVLHPKDLNQVEKIGEKIAQADILRAKASSLISETSSKIESLLC